MKIPLLIACLAAPLCAVAEGPAPTLPALPTVPQPLRLPSPPRVWLGLEVSKPEESISAQLPDLPPGIGFIVRATDKGGPADSAGLREFDVIWKLGDQMLVNESQLAALLRLHQPGDEVALAGFRGGKPLAVKLKLAEAPNRTAPLPDELVDDTILPSACREPMRVVNLSDKVASYANEQGRIEIRREGDGYFVKIEGPQQESIFEGQVAADSDFEGVPADWRRRVHALRRGLDHQLQARLLPLRQTRPRVVPPAEPNP